jgi:hypothetical protein
VCADRLPEQRHKGCFDLLAQCLVRHECGGDFKRPGRRGCK